LYYIKLNSIHRSIIILYTDIQKYNCLFRRNDTEKTTSCAVHENCNMKEYKNDQCYMDGITAVA